MAIGAGPALAEAFVRIRPTDTGFRAEADAKIKAALAGLDPKVRIGASTDAAKLAVTDLRAYIDRLAAKVAEFRVRGDISAADQIALTRIYAQLLRLDKKVFSAKLTVLGATTAQAQVMALDQSLRGLEKTWADTDAAAQAAMNDMVTAGGRFFGLWGAKIKLFGGVLKLGMLASIGAIHLLAQGILEVAAVLIPATIAAIAFGAAAAPAVGEITKQMQNLQIATEATGKHLFPLTGGFQKVADAVRPQVYQLFGDALTLINSRMGVFQKLATEAGTAIDQLAARSVVAFKSGGMQFFIQHATEDLAKIGDLVGNIFGIVGNLLKQLPGYAQVLLNILDNVSHGIEVFTGTAAVQKIIGFGLASHGAFIYLGLGATLAAFAVRRGLGLISQIALSSAIGLGRLGAVGKVAAVGMERFAFASAGAAALPWGWIALAATAVGLLAFKILTAQDATQRWVGSLQQALLAQKAAGGAAALQNAQFQVATRLIGVQANLTRETQKYAGTLVLARDRGGTLNQQLRSNIKAEGELTSAQKILNDQTVLYNVRLTKLAVIFGGVGAAQGILAASGITMKQMLDKSAEAWLMILQQVGATQAAYKAMGQTQGVLGADMNALNIQASDQVTQMAKLNQAFDGLMTTIGGGQSTFVIFEQGLAAVRIAAKAAGASMSGINTPSLALRQAWNALFAAAGPLVDAMRNMSALHAGGFPFLSRAVKDALAQMIPFGKQSKATRAELVAMANQINPTVHNFKDLVTWIGNVHKPGQDLNKLLANMGIDIQDVSKDAADMQASLKRNLLDQFNLDKLAASGVSAQLKIVAADINNTGKSAQQKHQDLVTLYNDLRKAGLSAKDAKDMIFALTGQILKIPKHHPFDVIGTGKGHFSISQGGIFASTAPGSPALAHPAAAGMFVGMGTTPTADDVMIRASKGELVVPTHMVNAGAVDHLRGRIPGFAGGGLIPNPGSFRELIPAIPAFYQNFGKRMINALESAMVTAIKSAQSFAVPGGVSGLGRASLRQIENWWIGAGGPGGGWAHIAAAITGAESGFRPGAVQQGQPYATTGWGLWQITPGNSEPQFGINQALLNPVNNAGAAVAKFKGAGYTFAPWTTFMDGAYLQFMKHGGKVMDSGGWLAPGVSTVVNRTGRPEHLVPAGGRRGGDVHIHGDLCVRETADAYLISRQLAFQLDQ